MTLSKAQKLIINKLVLLNDPVVQTVLLKGWPPKVLIADGNLAFLEPPPALRRPLGGDGHSLSIIFEPIGTNIQGELALFINTTHEELKACIGELNLLNFVNFGLYVRQEVLAGERMWYVDTSTGAKCVLIDTLINLVDNIVSLFVDGKHTIHLYKSS